MSHHPRRVFTPRKRKGWEYIFSNPSTPTAPNSLSKAPAKTEPVSVSKADGFTEPGSSNRLLAGYMAYEFLTKGTIFGQNFDPARTEAVPLTGGSSAESKRMKTKLEAEPGAKKENKSYDEVASIVMSDGTRIPGIVNPTQLARWIQM